MSISLQANPISWLRDLLLLSVGIGALFAFMLGSRPLSVPDEARYSEIPREMVATGNYLTPRLNGVKYFEKPPLFYWLQAGSIRLLGLGEWSLRLWPALFALAGCLAVYTAGRVLFGRETGLLSAVVLATSLLYYALSRMIILDMPVSVLLTIALLAFLLGTRGPPGRRRRLYLWGFYILAALATLTKGLIGILIPGMVIAAWITILWEWRMLKTLYLPSGIALFLLIAAPWHILAAQANPEFAYFYFVHEHLLRYLTEVHHRYQPAWYYIPVLLLGLFPWTAFLLQALERSVTRVWTDRHKHRETLFLLLWAGLTVAFFSASDSKMVPYILPAFPPLALLIGQYLAQARQRLGRHALRPAAWMLLVAAGLLAAAVYALPHFSLSATATEAARVHGYGLIAILLAGAAGVALLAKRCGFLSALSALVAATALSLAMMNSLVPYIDTRSIKPLAQALKPMLRPGDEVVSYHTYYQDLPVYLERVTTVVEYRGEMDFGTRIEDVNRWMIDEAELWRRWTGAGKVFVLTSRQNYDKLRADRHLGGHLLALTERDVLIANKAPQ